MSCGSQLRSRANYDRHDLSTYKAVDSKNSDLIAQVTKLPHAFFLGGRGVFNWTFDKFDAWSGPDFSRSHKRQGASVWFMGLWFNLYIIKCSPISVGREGLHGVRVQPCARFPGRDG